MCCGSNILWNKKEKINSDLTDVVFTDICMPGIDGIELVRWIYILLNVER